MTNEEFNKQFCKRTRNFAIKILKFIETLPHTAGGKVVSYQLGKAGTSAGANYRAFTRGRSRNERFSKICIVVEEADETEYWLDLCSGVGYGDQILCLDLLKEVDEIIRVTSKTKNGFYPKTP